MNVSLTPELEKFVAGKVASGRYNSASEVMREALRLLEEHDQARTRKLAAFQPGTWPTPGRARPWGTGRSGSGTETAAAEIHGAQAAQCMKKYVLSAAAELDLEAIWEYIAEDNIDAADQWIGKLFDAFETIEQTPAHRSYARRSHFLSGALLAGWRLPGSLPRPKASGRDCGRNPGSQGYPGIPSPAYPVAQGTEC